MSSDHLQRVVLLVLLDGPGSRTVASVAGELKQPENAIRAALTALERDGLAERADGGVQASRAAFRMDALELVAI